MNQYGTQALLHWQNFLPERYIEIDDPKTYFTNLGEDISHAIAQREVELATARENTDPVNGGYQQKTALLNTAHLQAETEVLREFLPEPSDEETPTQDLTDRMQRIDATTRP